MQYKRTSADSHIDLPWLPPDLFTSNATGALKDRMPRTPRAVIHQISKDVARVLEMSDVKERMYAISFDPAASTPEEYDRMIRNQMEIFTKVARSAGLLAK